MDSDSAHPMPDAGVLGPHPSPEETLRFVQAFFDALDETGAAHGRPPATPSAAPGPSRTAESHRHSAGPLASSAAAPGIAPHRRPDPPGT